MLTLYQRTDCPFCWKVRLALCELNIPFQIVECKLGKPHADLASLSPTQTVPVVVDDDLVIWDSAVILEYLNESYSYSELFPNPPVDSAINRLIHAYCDKQVGIALRQIVAEKRHKPESSWDLLMLAKLEKEWHMSLRWLEKQINKMSQKTQLSAAECALAARLGVAEAYDVPIPEQFPALQNWFTRAKASETWSKAYPTSFIRYSNVMEK